MIDSQILRSVVLTSRRGRKCAPAHVIGLSNLIAENSTHFDAAVDFPIVHIEPENYIGCKAECLEPKESDTDSWKFIKLTSLSLRFDLL
jgi:hypothetical protein